MGRPWSRHSRGFERETDALERILDSRRGAGGPAIVEEWSSAALLQHPGDRGLFRDDADHRAALLHLADAQRDLRLWAAARGTYERLSSPPSAEAAVALTRFLECGIRLDDPAAVVDEFLRARRTWGIPNSGRPGPPLPPEASFLAGAAAFRRTDLPPQERDRDALQILQSVPAPFDVAAAYYRGALFVRAGSLDRARQEFEACDLLPARTQRQRESQEMCWLALARIDGQRWPWDSERYWYAQLTPGFPYLQDALYEQASNLHWAGVDATALRVVDRMAAGNPDSPLAWDTDLLRAGILTGLGRHPDAIAAYDRIRRQATAQRDRLDEALRARREPAAWLALFTESQWSGGPAPGLPPQAVRAARSSAKVARALEILEPRRALEPVARPGSCRLGPAGRGPGAGRRRAPALAGRILGERARRRGPGARAPGGCGGGGDPRERRFAGIPDRGPEAAAAPGGRRPLPPRPPPGARDERRPADRRASRSRCPSAGARRGAGEPAGRGPPAGSPALRRAGESWGSGSTRRSSTSAPGWMAWSWNPTGDSWRWRWPARGTRSGGSRRWCSGAGWSRSWPAREIGPPRSTPSRRESARPTRRRGESAQRPSVSSRSTSSGTRRIRCTRPACSPAWPSSRSWRRTPARRRLRTALNPPPGSSTIRAWRSRPAAARAWSPCTAGSPRASPPTARGTPCTSSPATAWARWARVPRRDRPTSTSSRSIRTAPTWRRPGCASATWRSRTGGRKRSAPRSTPTGRRPGLAITRSRPTQRT